MILLGNRAVEVSMDTKDLLIAVIDGQGGGMGRSLVAQLHQEFPEVRIMALGTNSAATSAMLRAGIKEGATGENAIAFNVSQADIITGPVGIIMPYGLLGEVTLRMAEAIGHSSAKKILLPSNQCNICLALGETQTMQFYLEDCVNRIKEEIDRLLR